MFLIRNEALKLSDFIYLFLCFPDLSEVSHRFVLDFRGKIQETPDSGQLLDVSHSSNRCIGRVHDRQSFLLLLYHNGFSKGICFEFWTCLVSDM